MMMNIQGQTPIMQPDSNPLSQRPSDQGHAGDSAATGTGYSHVLTCRCKNMKSQLRNALLLIFTEFFYHSLIRIGPQCLRTL
jgi:hypothetical protein